MLLRVMVVVMRFVFRRMSVRALPQDSALDPAGWIGDARARGRHPDERHHDRDQATTQAIAAEIHRLERPGGDV